LSRFAGFVPVFPMDLTNIVPAGTNVLQKIATSLAECAM
jgi:hypothetical protein